MPATFTPLTASTTLVRSEKEAYNNGTQVKGPNEKKQD